MLLMITVHLNEARSDLTRSDAVGWNVPKFQAHFISIFNFPVKCLLLRPLIPSKSCWWIPIAFHFFRLETPHISCWPNPIFSSCNLDVWPYFGRFKLHFWLLHRGFPRKLLLLGPPTISRAFSERRRRRHGDMATASTATLQLCGRTREYRRLAARWSARPEQLEPWLLEIGCHEGAERCKKGGVSIGWSTTDNGWWDESLQGGAPVNAKLMHLFVQFHVYRWYISILSGITVQLRPPWMIWFVKQRELWTSSSHIFQTIHCFSIFGWPFASLKPGCD